MALARTRQFPSPLYQNSTWTSEGPGYTPSYLIYDIGSLQSAIETSNVLVQRKYATAGLMTGLRERLSSSNAIEKETRHKIRAADDSKSMLYHPRAAEKDTVQHCQNNH